MLISVIIPSMLKPIPNHLSGMLWLDRALLSLRFQTTFGQVSLQVVVGLDHGAVLPERFTGVVPAYGRPNSFAPQGAAINAAVAASSGDILAFLEDDDYWEPTRLVSGLEGIKTYDVVTTSQREIDLRGTFLRVLDYATPSGWLFSRKIWDRLGPLDESFRYHLDTEYLGRFNAAGLKRLHLAEAAAPNRTALKCVAEFSDIGRTAEVIPLVTRTVHPASTLLDTQQDETKRAQSENEYNRLRQLYGLIPC